jgi:hypothetical protein
MTRERSFASYPRGTLPPIHIPYLLGGGDLVADALGGDLAFELGEGEEDIEGQSTHGRGGVELLGHRDEGDLMGIEDLDDLGEVGQRPGEAIDLVDHDHVDLPGFDVGKEAL